MSNSEQRDKAVVNEEALIDQASAWFLRLRSEETSAANSEAFQLWLAQDLRHEAAYMQVQTAWNRMGDFSETPELMVAR